MSRRLVRIALVVAPALVLAFASRPVHAAEPASAPSASSTSSAQPASSGLAPAGRPLSLAEALERFRRQNLELAASRFDVSAARADALGAGLYANPTFSATGAFLAHGVPSGGRQELYLTVTQAAPIAGQVGLRRDAAQGFATAAEREFAATAWQLASDVRLAYLELQVAQAKLAIAVAASRDLDRVQAIITERVTAGANPTYDRVRVGIEQSGTRARQTDAETDVFAARATLAQTIGREVDPATLVAEDLSGEPAELPADARALVSAALARRAEVAAAKALVSASDLRTEAAKRGVVPTPDVSLGYSHFFRIPGDPSPKDGGAVTVGLSIPLPLFDRGQGTVGRSTAEAEAQRLRARQVEVTISRDVELAYATAAARGAAWRSFRDTVAGEVERMRQMAEVSYREGRGSVLELLDAYGSYVVARSRAVELRGAALRASQQLGRAVGPASPRDVPTL